MEHHTESDSKITFVQNDESWTLLPGADHPISHWKQLEEDPPDNRTILHYLHIVISVLNLGRAGNRREKKYSKHCQALISIQSFGSKLPTYMWMAGINIAVYLHSISNLQK